MKPHLLFFILLTSATSALAHTSSYELMYKNIDVLGSVHDHGGDYDSYIGEIDLKREFDRLYRVRLLSEALGHQDISLKVDLTVPP